MFTIPILVLIFMSAACILVAYNVGYEKGFQKGAAWIHHMRKILPENFESISAKYRAELEAEADAEIQKLYESVQKR